jgi:hypothetical protein
MEFMPLFLILSTIGSIFVLVVLAVLLFRYREQLFPGLEPRHAGAILFGAAFVIIGIAGTSLMLWFDAVIAATIFGLIFVGVGGVMLAVNLRNLPDQE